MKFAVAKEHRDFFRNHSRIEFNQLLSEEQCQQLLEASTKVLSERLNVSKANFRFTPSGNQFMAGFDVWRGSGAIKKIVLQKNLAAIAAELLEITTLRIGFDQLIPSLTLPVTPEDPYRRWLMQTASLQDITSIQGIVAGVVLCIKAPSEASANTEEPLKTIPSLFSTTLGNGVYFRADVPLDFSEMAARKDYTYLLITYAKDVSVYCKKENDPHTNSFKQWGYQFGDRLSNRYHPLIVF